MIHNYGLMSSCGYTGVSWESSKGPECDQLRGQYVHEFFLLVGLLFLGFNKYMALAACAEMDQGCGPGLLK